MHSMVDSANSRESRKAQTRADLVRHARRLTAAHGLSGFTIEELSELAGVSRRTFFNYFATKESAVLGARPVEQLEEALAEFAYSPPAGDALPELLIEFLVAQFEASGMAREEITDFLAAVDREPRLLADLLKDSSEDEDRLTRAIAVREHLDPQDPAARAAAMFSIMILRRSGFEYFQPENDLPFGDIAAINLHAVRRVFAPTTTRTPENDRNRH